MVPSHVGYMVAIGLLHSGYVMITWLHDGCLEVGYGGCMMVT